MLSEEQKSIVSKYPSANHFDMIHPPRTLQELIAFLDGNPHTILWAQERQPCCVSQQSVYLHHGSNAKSCLILSMQNHRFCLAGTSDEQVAQLAVMLWSLSQDYEESFSDVYIHGPSNSTNFASFDYNALGAEWILPSLLSQRKVTFVNVQVPNYLAAQLASQSRPIDLTLFDSTFGDDGKSFLQALVQRRDKTPSSFGTLTFNGCSTMSTLFLSQLYQVKELDLLRIVTFDRPARTNNRLPFAANAQKVEYEMVNPGNEWENVASVTLVSKRFILKRTKDVYGFSSVFLRATTNLVEMGLVTMYLLTKETQRDLIAAVNCNRNLQVLEFGPVEGISLESEWQDLMEVLGRRTCLWKLKLHCRCYYEHAIDVDEGLRIDSLLSMMKTNRNIIEIDVVGARNEIWMDALNTILRFNRLFQGSRSIKQKNESDRVRLLSGAILERDDPQMLAFLLLDHLDVICMLLLKN